MIKFLAEGKDGPLIGLGLLPENIIRLQADEPILIDLQKLKPDLPAIDVVIFFASSSEYIQEQMRKHGIITDKTIIHEE